MVPRVCPVFFVLLAFSAEAFGDQILLRELAPAVQPVNVSGLAIADDHPRLAEFIQRGLVQRGPKRNWGSEQVTGKPDTEGAGDKSTAWASKSQDGQEEWLELTYEQAIKPVEVHVVETFNPGALFKVTAVTPSGMDATLWKGEDPTRADVAEGRGTSVVKVRAAVKTNRIRIHLASDKVPGWNEIDAVGIKDGAGKIHWAKSATASSEYASGPKPGWIMPSADALKELDVLYRELDELRARVRQLEAKRD